MDSESRPSALVSPKPEDGSARHPPPPPPPQVFPQRSSMSYRQWLDCLQSESVYSSATDKTECDASLLLGEADVTQDMLSKVLIGLPEQSDKDEEQSEFKQAKVGNEKLRPDDLMQWTRTPSFSPSNSACGGSESNGSSTRSAIGDGASSSEQVAVAQYCKDKLKHTGSDYALAFKYPEDKPFRIEMDLPLYNCLVDEPNENKLNSLQEQKLRETTLSLQGMNIHALDPLALYSKHQLYNLMSSIAEVWKNSGKSAWKKRINKINSNVRQRKHPRNVHDEKELEEIRELEEKIRQREIWEKTEKLKLSLTSQNPSGRNEANAKRQKHQR